MKQMQFPKSQVTACWFSQSWFFQLKLNSRDLLFSPAFQSLFHWLWGSFYTPTRNNCDSQVHSRSYSPTLLLGLRGKALWVTPSLTQIVQFIPLASAFINSSLLCSLIPACHSGVAFDLELHTQAQLMSWGSASKPSVRPWPFAPCVFCLAGVG